MYARPVDGVIGFVDTGRRRVVRVDDHGVVPVPPVGGGYLPDDVGPLRSGLRPLDISQPEGPSFTIEGGLCVAGLVDEGLDERPRGAGAAHHRATSIGGRVRPILFRASMTRWSSPTARPAPCSVEERLRRQ